MHRIGWYLKRIRVMSLREIIYRIREQLTMISMRVEHRFGLESAKSTGEWDPEKFGFCHGTRTHLPPLLFDDVALRQAYDRLMRGEVPVADKVWRWEDKAGIWHSAPDTGKTWPSVFFGSINYREGNPYGDIRHLWEPARLQQLVELAMLAHSGDASEREQAAQTVRLQLTSWIQGNPPLVGPHYISAMECGLRLIASCHAVDMLRQDFGGNAPWEALLSLAGNHARFVERRMSLHSSTGNHTVAEAAGLVYAGLLFSEMEKSQQWLAKGVSTLTEAAGSQVLADGGGVEQAFCYHRFNIELLSLSAALLAHYEQPVPPAITEAVDRGNRFLEAMRLPNGQIPSIGDGDGGYALSRYLRLAPSCTEENRESLVYPDSGYVKAQVASSPGAVLIFDCGPLGMPPVYGHGHADALSVLLQYAGEDVFIDPGTYTYTGDPAWRRYFRSTPAHNTVTVDGRDQARQDGCFLWSRPFSVRLIDSDLGGNEGRLIAEHDGYRDIGVRHVRGLAWMQNGSLLVWDRVSGKGERSLELNWHLARDAELRSDESFDVPLAAGAIPVRCHGGEISTHRGESMPVSGWRSPCYGRLEPATTVKVRHYGPLPHTFTTLVGLGEPPPTGEAIKDACEWMKERCR